MIFQWVIWIKAVGMGFSNALFFIIFTFFFVLGVGSSSVPNWPKKRRKSTNISGKGVYPFFAFWSLEFFSFFSIFFVSGLQGVLQNAWFIICAVKPWGSECRQFKSNTQEFHVVILGLMVSPLYHCLNAHCLVWNMVMIKYPSIIAIFVNTPIHPVLECLSDWEQSFADFRPVNWWFPANVSLRGVPIWVKHCFLPIISGKGITLFICKLNIWCSRRLDTHWLIQA